MGSRETSWRELRNTCSWKNLESSITRPAPRPVERRTKRRKTVRVGWVKGMTDAETIKTDQSGSRGTHPWRPRGEGFWTRLSTLSWSLLQGKWPDQTMSTEGSSVDTIKKTCTRPRSARQWRIRSRNLSKLGTSIDSSGMAETHPAERNPPDVQGHPSTVEMTETTETTNSLGGTILPARMTLPTEEVTKRL